jgi:dTDP-4-amino-4,6-dideoxygalactose transaminase
MRYKVAHRTDIAFDGALWGDGSSPVEYAPCEIEPYEDEDGTVYCITTADGNFATTTATVHNCSQEIKEVGYKYHMNDIAAALGLANLPHLDDILGAQRKNANFYATVMCSLPGVLLPPSLLNPGIGPNEVEDMARRDGDSAFWLFTLLVSNRDSFSAFMADRNIMVSPVHARNDIHPGFRDSTITPDPPDPLPGVDFFAEHEVAIPVGWWLTEGQRYEVATAVYDWANAHGDRTSLKPPTTL